MTKLSSVEISLLEIKFDKPRGDSGVRQVDIIVADITDSDGASGLGFSYVIGGGAAIPARIASDLADRFLSDTTFEHPEVHWRGIKASFNRTGGGPNLIALDALDVGLWDLHANRAGRSLSVAMGGDGGSVPIYGRGGFSPAMGPAEAAEIAMAHREAGFRDYRRTPLSTRPLRSFSRTDDSGALDRGFPAARRGLRRLARDDCEWRDVGARNDRARPAPDRCGAQIAGLNARL
ncbi:MAG: hypothetical protein ACPGQM_14865 [Alphaproteobacteria bacterium]